MANLKQLILPLFLTILLIGDVCAVRRRQLFSNSSGSKSEDWIDWFLDWVLPDDEVYGETVTQNDKLVERRLHLAPKGFSEARHSNVGHYAGYYNLDGTHESRMFYLFFESRNEPSTDPVVLWMTGGPGCASELAVLYENGPYKINSDNSTLTWNPYGWDKVANIIFVDQPINTGFSYSNDSRDMRHDEKGVSQDVYQFLQEFFSTHPQYQNNEFFITGESYAGHYVPAVTSKVHLENKKGNGIYINLKGFAIGNGLTDPAIQYPSYADFALHNRLITEYQYSVFASKYKTCKLAIKACGTNGKISCAAAYIMCNLWFENLFTAAGDINMYDIRLPCTYSPLCYDFSPLENYLNQDEVRKALGVTREFKSCDSNVYQAMITDFMRDLEPVIPTLLEDGIRLLVYAGNKDFICNWLGNSRWVAAMEWYGQAQFLDAPWTKFDVEGYNHGLSTSYGPLTFLAVYEAGHMVPMDQPQASLEMLHRFISNEPIGYAYDSQDDMDVDLTPHPRAKSSSLL